MTKNKNINISPSKGISIVIKNDFQQPPEVKPKRKRKYKKKLLKKQIRKVTRHIFLHHQAV